MRNHNKLTSVQQGGAPIDSMFPYLSGLEGVSVSDPDAFILFILRLRRFFRNFVMPLPHCGTAA